MNYKKSKRTILALSLVFIVVVMVGYGSTASGLWDWSYKCDIVIKNGRVMDPLTRTDKIATVGIKNGEIAYITTLPGLTAILCTQAKRVIDARGLVVAPGFINIHAHESTGMTMSMTMNVSVRDGITLIVGGNCGGSPYPLEDYFEDLEEMGMSSNYAAYIGHNTLRSLVGLSSTKPANATQIAQMVQLVEQEMAAGALGVSYGPFYHPGATFSEMLATATKCAELGGGTAIHVRQAVPLIDPTTGEPLTIVAIKEAIQIANQSGVPLIISHLGGPTYGAAQTGWALEVISKALMAGVKLAADALPYDSFDNRITHPVFRMLPVEMLLKLVDATASDLEVAHTVVINGSVYMNAHQRFNSTEQFVYVRDLALAGVIPDPGVLGHLYRPEKIMLWYSAQFAMVCNDGGVGFDPATGTYGTTHPRIAGSFSKFLGDWVREKGLCDLMTGLYKTSTAAALFLGLDKKGRVQVGCDADLVLFDPYTIIDTATYDWEGSLNPPIGLPYVIVNGKLVVNNGQLTGETPGEAIRRTWTVPGVLPGPWTGRDGLGLLDEEDW